MIAREGNNYSRERSNAHRNGSRAPARLSSPLLTFPRSDWPRIKNSGSNSAPACIPDASRFHNENRGLRRAGDNPWQSRGSRVCCVDGRAYVYTRPRTYRGVTGSDHDTDVPLPSSCATTMFMFWHSAE